MAHGSEQPPALHDLHLAISTLILSGLMLVLTSRKRWQLEEPAEDGSPRYTITGSWIRVAGFAIRAVCFVCTILAVVGYTDMALLTMLHMIGVIAAIVVAVAIRSVLREAVQWVLSQASSEGPSHPDKQDEPSVWLDLTIDTLVFFGTIPVLLLVIGFNWLDLLSIGNRIAQGVEIGGQRFSPLQVGIAILAFTILMTATRFFQRLIQRRLFSRMRMDIGVENSLKTLIGYVGLLIALFTGVSMMGFDLSSLAIVAGALSVGIGFGLQSIVNNFVSGLILLFERPIKVGDWVVTTSGEGIVQKISVRSTEIETFDRSSILVPNSELISSSVTNWTHKNTLGRVTVPVGVSYNEDPDRILEILSGVPERLDIILNEPPALVLFTGFGDSSLDFEIRAYIPDVSKSLTSRTALRVEIFKAFREAGVEIPFPQRDLHLRSIDVPETQLFGGRKALPDASDDTE